MQRKSRLTLVMMAALLMVGMVGIQSAKPVQAALPTDLFFSEYIEGGSFNKAIEIYNGTGSPIDLSDYSLELYSNGALTPSQSVVLSGTVATGDVYVVSRADAAAEIVAQADLLNASVVNWNGNDAIVLRAPDDSVLDVFGVVGNDPGSSWGTGDYTTADHTLVRSPDVCGGDSDGSDAFDPSIEWISFPKNTVTEIGSHTSSCAPDIFPERFIISEYVEGSSNNKAIELFNGTGAEINLQNYFIRLYSNGSTSSSSTLVWEEETLLPAGETFVVVDSAASEALKAYADLLHAVTAFDGNDTLVLYEITSDGNIIRDSFGRLGYAPPNGWGSDDTSTVDHTLVRKETICQGDIMPEDEFDPVLEYNGFAIDTFTNLGSHTMICGPGDQAPIVASTLPTNGGTAQKTDDIVITFSEPVTVTDSWFSISCTDSGPHTAVVTDADPIFTLNPIEDFEVGETCTVTIDHTKVYDDDTDDATANYMLENYTFSFTAVTPPEGCGDPYTHTYEIQGTGETSPLAGTALATEGVVVGDFQTGGKNGYYIQDLTGDGETATSDGIFVYNTTTAVNVGDHVRVRGTVVEYNGITEISPVEQVWICSTGNTITPTPVTLPVEAVTDFEKYESMLVTFPQPLVISEYFNFDRYGEIVLTSTRHMTPTAFVEPGEDAIAAAQAYLLDRITLDDGRTTQNPDPAIHPNGDIFDMDNLFRGGGTVTDVTGVLDYSYNLYRVQPTTGATYADANPRTTAPEILEGDLKVASFNVLNYFVTLDDGTHDICGPSGDMECRGADTADEFERQRAKILSALGAIDADIFGLMEIENEHPGGGDAVADLVAGLNLIKGAGTYAYIDTGAIGGDAIKQAILYKPASVTPVGEYQILDSSVDSRFIDTKNRPVLAQVFRDNATGDEFVVAVNHLKSKGSDCNDLGDPDTGDGQGNCNLTRKAAAQALVDWLANPTYFPELEKVLIIGDLNSYDKEDPIDAIKLGADDTAATADDYLDMIFEKRGEYAYGYVFDGQTGYLDHALANPAMAEAVVDVNFWHINADEPDLIDYDMSFKLPAQDALYEPDAYRSSDHDPVIITLNMNAAPVAVADAYTTDEDTVLTVLAPGVLENDTDPEGDTLTAILVSDVNHGTLDLAANGSFVYTPAENFSDTDSFTYEASDGKSESDPVIVTITVSPTSDAPVAQDQTVIVNQNTPKEITLVATDADGDTLTYEIVENPAHGTLTTLVGNVTTYTPTTGYAGPDSFTFKAYGGSLYSNVATVTITVNTPPLADDQSVTTDEDTAKEIALGATDVEEDPLEYSIVGQPDHGDVVLVDNLATYTPDPDYNGPDSFTFKVNDGTADSNVATVSITVTPVNDAPVAVDLTETTEEDTPVNITLVATDVEGDTLTYAFVDPPAHGTVTLDGTTATYTPELNFNGPDSFTYKANDGLEDSEMAVVTITVTPVNDAPVALEDQYETDEDLMLTVAAPGILENDFDVEGDEMTIFPVDDVSNGTLDWTLNGGFIYTPDAEFNGIDTFSYKLTDGEAYSDTVVVTITVNSVNDWVTANDDEYETMTGVTLDIAAPGVLANDVLLDPDETISLDVIAEPGSGTLTLNDDGSFTYVPNAGFFGVDTFEYQLISTLPTMLQGEFSDTAIVTIKVTAKQIFLPLILR